MNEIVNEVYGTMTLDFSVDVGSDDKEMAMLEAAYMVDPLAVAHVIVIIIDAMGREHKINIHDYKSELHKFLN